MAHERNVVKIDADVDISLLGPLGCGIQTGAGSVLNALNPTAGSAIAIFGAGAVGLEMAQAFARFGAAVTVVARSGVPWLLL